MRNWTIGKRIITGFASVILIALALGAFAYTRLIVINQHSDKIIKQVLPTITMVNQVRKIAKDQVQLAYKHIGSSDKEDIARLEAAMRSGSASNETIYAELEKLLTSEKDRALFDNVKVARAENNRSRAQVLAASAQLTNKLQAYNMARTEFDPINARYLAALDSLIESVNGDADYATDTIQSAVESSKAGIATGLSLTLIVGLGVAFVISRGTSRILGNLSSLLNQGAGQMASAAGQVAASSQTLAEGASEQAASLEETSSSLEEMASMTKRNSENAHKANDLARQARTAADRGVGDMQTMSASMEAIKVSSDDIAKIIKTIDEIAFQTNILALNAAVEAARAGEAGMGFAVVADEVRNLAQRSAQAAKETAAKIEGAITKTAQGVVISSKVAQTLNEILAKVREVDELVAEVAGASREQTEGITQINIAVSHMDKVTQSNAASAEESAAAAEELNAQAETMQQSVTELQQLVVGTGQNTVMRTMASPRRAKELSITAPAAKRPAPIRTNGHARVATASSSASNGRSEIPMDADFKDF